jgi:hypothetical protein
VGETFQLGDRKHGVGVFWSVVFENNPEKNPLHLTAGLCPYITIEQEQGTALALGRCAWSDAAGDQIFTEFRGTIDLVTGAYVGLSQEITGGTGKFASITGIEGEDDVPHTCEGWPQSPTQGLCVQHFKYRLP